MGIIFFHQIQLFYDCVSYATSVNMMLAVKFQGTGSVLLDMQKQLQANVIRIKVLGQENTSLHSTIEKLRHSAQRSASEVRLACICSMLVA